MAGAMVGIAGGGDVRSARRRGARLRLTYIIGRYPLLTTTFIDREISGLLRRGVQINIISIRRPDGVLSSRQKQLGEGVRYLLPIGPVRLVGSHAWFLLARPVRYATTFAYLLSRRHDSWQKRWKTVLHFGEAVCIANAIRNGGPTDHLHAHFLDRAAVMALVSSRLLNIPYSATAHASEIYVEPALLPEKLRTAKFVATCTRYNHSHLAGVADSTEGSNVVLVYHGLDIDDYQPAPPQPPSVPVILAVAQLKERKGLQYLVEACRLLADRGCEFETVIIGDGPLRTDLENRIRELRLTDRVSIHGPQPHDEVIEWYRRAAIFTLPAVQGADGDRDGIPNVILEAMAMALPVVATDHSGIPEAVLDGQTGLLAPPADPNSLADRLDLLLHDPGMRKRFGERGRQLVSRNFDVERNTEALLEQFLG